MAAMHINDVLHTLIDKSGADESVRLDMHDAVDAADAERIAAMSDLEKAGRRAAVDRASVGTGGPAVIFTQSDVDKAVAATMAKYGFKLPAEAA